MTNLGMANWLRHPNKYQKDPYEAKGPYPYYKADPPGSALRVGQILHFGKNLFITNMSMTRNRTDPLRLDQSIEKDKMFNDVEEDIKKIGVMN